MGPGVAMECLETKDGLTIWEDHFYPEIINPETSEVLADGELGELVFYHDYQRRHACHSLPNPRFDSFIARHSKNNARLMNLKVVGIDDVMIIRGVNVFPSQIEEQILQILNWFLIMRFRFVNKVIWMDCTSVQKCVKIYLRKYTHNCVLAQN